MAEIEAPFRATRGGAHPVLGGPSGTTSCARWIRAAAGEAVYVRISLVDGAGRLRVGAVDGIEPSAGDTSRHRRHTFVSGRESIVPLRSGRGLALGLFPLGRRDDVFGVVEVLGDHATIEARLDALRDVVAVAAEDLAPRARAPQPEQPTAPRDMLLELASNLLSARTATEAVRTTVRVAHRQVGVPVVGLLPDRDHLGWFVAAAEGLGARRRAHVLRSLQEQPPTGRAVRPSVVTLRRRFLETTGCHAVIAVRARGAVLLFGDAGARAFAARAASLLSEVLGRTGVVAPNPQHPSRDIGLAWTAHELREPLLGVKATLELALAEANGSTEADRVRLARSLDELERLSGLLEAVLGLSGGGRTLERRPLDLVELVDEVVADRTREAGDDRVVVHAPETIVVSADPVHLRTAVANIVRNALIHARADSKVDVTIERHDHAAVLSVHNEGSVIPQGMSSIFEPFVRIDGAGAGRPGTGIGLFVARRVVEGHGGRIWFESSAGGTTFHVRLPIASGGPR